MTALVHQTSEVFGETAAIHNRTENHLESSAPPAHDRLAKSYLLPGKSKQNEAQERLEGRRARLVASCWWNVGLMDLLNAAERL